MLEVAIGVLVIKCKDHKQAIGCLEKGNEETVNQYEDVDVLDVLEKASNENEEGGSREVKSLNNHFDILSWVLFI